MRFKRGATEAAWSILLLLAISMPCLADGTPGNLRVIEVSGTGEVRSAPDVGYLSVQIETHAASAGECSAKNAALAGKVVQELKAKLDGKGTVVTGDYSLNPEYAENSGRQKPIITGYTAQNTITIETPELSILGGLIDAAISSGVNRINYISFGLRDDINARQHAIALASKDAQAQALALATSLNVKLKRVVIATTMPERPPIMPMQRMAATFASAEAKQPTPIEATQISVSATVSLTYEIE